MDDRPSAAPTRSERLHARRSFRSDKVPRAAQRRAGRGAPADAQKERDRRAGLNTAGFVSGYRGSPVGGLDQQFLRLAELFAANDIHFEPGLNEELAATASGARNRRRCAAKAASTACSASGTARARASTARGDAFRHANLAGTSRQRRRAGADGRRPDRGILDHRASIGIRLRRCDDAGPVAGRRAGGARLRRARLGAEPLRRRLGRLEMPQGHDRIDRRGRRLARPRRADRRRTDFAMPPGGLNIRRIDAVLAQEARLHEHKLPAMLAWLAANRLNRDHRHRRRGGASSASSRSANPISTCARRSTRSASTRRAATRSACASTSSAAPGRSSRSALREFADGLSTDHRRRGEALADRGAGARRALRRAEPAEHVVGKRDEDGPMAVSRARARSIRRSIASPSANGCSTLHLTKRARRGAQAECARSRGEIAALAEEAASHALFLLGLPAQPFDDRARGRARLCRHRLPFHGAVPWTARPKASPRWAAKAPTGSANRFFSNAPPRVPESRRRHLQSFRRAGACAGRSTRKVNITYKILFNDAVAMTGGQRHEGGLNVPQIAAASRPPTAPSRVVVVDRRRRQISARDQLAGGRRRAPARRPHRRRKGA